jgi:ABC-2 type transport system ATP-binding protein
VSEPAIELVDITKRFGTKSAVDGVSLTIQRGQVYGLIGPTAPGRRPPSP